jgi:excinuclease ABC subunit A
VAEGTPEAVAATPGSFTGRYLAPVLGARGAPARGKPAGPQPAPEAAPGRSAKASIAPARNGRRKVSSDLAS